MRHGLLLAGAALVLGLAGFAGCAAGDTNTTSGTGAGKTSSSGGTTTTTGMGGTTTTTTGMGGTTTTTTTTMGTGGSTTGTGGSTTGTGGMAGTGGGTGGSGPPPGLPLGADCTKDAECDSMLCKPVVIDSNPVCVIPCTQQSDCAAGAGFFCEPVTPGSTSGYCIPHSPAHCLSCVADANCGSLSEVCFQAPGDNIKACHIDCSIAGQSACPSDYSCVAETVNGQARQLCRPNIIPTCLDATGGYCDRLQLPQPCVRTNTAGNCIGQRLCLSASKRFDKCNAAAPQCKTDCSMQDPAGCMESFCASSTGTVTNCGTCGNVCPGYQKPSDNVTCDASQTCTFSCQGENYDVDGSTGDGCEAADAPTGNHTQSTAAGEGDVACYDGNGHTVHFTGTLLSDKRVHESPAVTGFDAASGSAPDWYTIHCTGQSSIVNPCVDDVVLTLTVTGSSSPTCYQFFVQTDKKTFTCQTNASGTCGFNAGSGQYTDGSTMLIEVSKICGTSVTENVSYTVDGHL